MARVTVVMMLLVVVCQLVLAGDALILRYELAEGRSSEQCAIFLGSGSGFDIWAHRIGAKSELYRAGPCWKLDNSQRSSLLFGWGSGDYAYLYPTWSSSRASICDDQLVAIDLQIPLNSKSRWAVYSPETRLLWEANDELMLGVSTSWFWAEGKSLTFKLGPAVRTTIGGCGFTGRCLRNLKTDQWECRLDITLPLKW